MKRKIQNLGFVFLLFMVHNKTIAQNDTIIHLKTSTIYYDDNKQIDLNLYKSSKVYFIQVCNNNDLQCSPVDCSSGIITKNTVESAYDDTISNLIIKYIHISADIKSDSLFKIMLSHPNIVAQIKASHSIFNDAMTSSETKKNNNSKDSIQNNLMFLTAANFDFSGKLSTSFLGVFNIFAPNLYNSKWGFIAGIEKINYSASNINGNDSNQVHYFAQNYLLNPLSFNRQLNSINAGAKYIQQYNQYTFTASNTVWSFYYQPMFRLVTINNSENGVGIYLHLHGELLVNQWTRTASIKNLYQNPDTSIAGNITNPSNFYWVQNNQIVSNSNFISGYFGFGSTIFVKPFSNANNTYFFGQFTIGEAFNTPNFSELNDPTVLLNPNGTYSVTSPDGTIINSSSKFFYLIRTNFIQSLSSSSQIVIGLVIRGNWTDTSPQYAAFAGLNLDLNAVVKLLTGK